MQRIHRKSATRNQLKVGPAGWSYADWNGVVYPTNRPAGFHEAEYLSHFFSVIEINTSFYRLPRQEVSRVWARKLSAAKNFEFTAKLYRGFTHDGRLERGEVRRFAEGLEPLIDAGLLGCLLMQFPWSFRCNRENLSYLLRVARAFGQYPLVAELRHASWNNSSALRALADQGVGFCNIDQPQLNQCLPPTAYVTSPIGYIRLHGRNYSEWFSRDAGAAERYNYLYSSEQLDKWRPRIEHVAAATAKTYVVTNNHFGGKAVANALEILATLKGEAVEAPETLLNHFPELAGIVKNQPAQRSLFFQAARETRSATGGYMPRRRVAAASYARA